MAIRENELFDDYETKLQNVCEANGLLYRLNKDVYPVTLTVEPDTSLDAQLSLAEEGAPPARRGASIKFVYAGGCLSYKTTGGFEVSDATFGKLKNLFKKLHYMWLQVFFAQTKQGVTEVDPAEFNQPAPPVADDFPPLAPPDDDFFAGGGGATGNDREE